MALTGVFDIYHVVIELIAGDLLSGMLLVALMILLIGLITNTNIVTIIFTEFLFIGVYMTAWYGTLIMAIVFLISFGYIIANVMRYLRDWQN